MSNYASGEEKNATKGMTCITKTALIMVAQNNNYYYDFFFVKKYKKSHKLLREFGTHDEMLIFYYYNSYPYVRVFDTRVCVCVCVCASNGWDKSDLMLLKCDDL